MTRARKRFGQHFLHARGVVERIVRAIAPRPGEPMVEIGPGTGVLTRALLAHRVRLTAIEIDRDLVPALAGEFAGNPDFRLIEADALGVDLAALHPGERIRVVGNLPYNVSTPLLFRCLGSAGSISAMHFMLQREVVNRIVAAPGGKDYGRLSIAVQRRCVATRVLDVGPGAFRPPPRVDSAVVRLEVRARPLATVRDAAGFDALIAHLFSRRRKTLRASLRGLVDTDALTGAGIDPRARAETLDIATLARLSDACRPGLFTDSVDKSVRNGPRGRDRPRDHGAGGELPKK